VRRLFIWLLFLLLAFGISAGLSYGWWRYQWRRAQQQLIQPLNRFGYVRFESPATLTSKKEVWGFLPYWTMNQASISAQVTDVAYFALMFNGAGQLVEKNNGGREPGYGRFQDEAFTEWLQAQHTAGRRVHLTITGLSADDIASLVTTETSRQTFIRSVQQIMASYPFDGVQMDLEYIGTVTDGIRAGYATLLGQLQTTLHSMDPRLELSVATYASAANRYTFFDIAAMAPKVDAIIVMAYDYHLRTSPAAGPVAPIFGSANGRWEHDIISNLRSYLKIVKPDKLILGIPFYGYEWTVTSDQPGSTTYPDSGAMATYKRVQTILNDPSKSAQERWDEDALSPYVIYKEHGKQQIIYFENTRSLGYKMDLIKELDMRGLAVWALGYEGETTELWRTVQDKLLFAPLK
jgi:spore germination protein YaaH